MPSPSEWIRILMGFARLIVSGDVRRWFPLRLSVHIVFLMSLATALAFTLFWLLGANVPGSQDFQRKPFEGLKIALAVVAGVGGVFALTVAFRRQRVSELADDREDIRLFNERFGAASSQLASDRAAERLAGAHALAGLADDWEDGRQTCIDVLCAYMGLP